MINYSTQLVSALNTILPTYYEMTLTKGIKTPCISYQEINNYVELNADTIGFSRVTYQVKVWGTNIEQLTNYALKIDAKLRPLGFTRVSCGELYDRNSTMIQKILTYEAVAYEEFN